MVNHDNVLEIQGEDCDPFKGNSQYVFFPSVNTLLYIIFFNHHKLIVHLGIA